MAIYSGEWLDGSGNPFCPGTVNRTNYNWGNYAQNPGPHLPNKKHRYQFMLGAKQSSHDYHEHLPDEEFDLLCEWDNFPGSTFRTDFPQLHALQPWERFNCRLFVDYFYAPITRHTWPVPTQPYTVAFTLLGADLASQTALLNVSYTVEGYPPPDTGFLVFHIDPHRIDSQRAVHFTRLAVDWEWSEGHAHGWDQQVRFQWPLTSEDKFAILIRVKQRWFWMQTHYRICTPT